MTSCKNDKLGYMIALAFCDLCEDEGREFLQMDVSDVEVPSRLDKRVFRTIRRKQREMQKVKISKRLIGVLVAAIAVMLAGIITICGMPNVRTAIWETVVEWYEEHISIKFETKGDDPAEQPDNGEPNATEQTFAYKAPQLGEEYQMTELLKTSNSYMVDYYLGEEWYCSYYQFPLNEDDQWYDKSEVTVQKIALNGQEYFLLYYVTDEIRHIAWQDGEYAYNISGYIDDLKLLELANTVK